MNTEDNIYGNDLLLRSATLEDAEILFKWRNDIQTRAASHSMSPLDFSQHLKWLQASLQNKDRSLYMAERKGKCVGTMRTDHIDGTFLLSWTIAPEARGQGVGKTMVRLLAGSIQAPIRAEIKKENSASIRIALHAGLELLREDEDGVLHFGK